MGTIVNPILQKYKDSPSLADTYGPYASVDAAHDALSDDRLNIIGMTVGIIDGDNIVEYWYQGGTAKNNLVPKGGSTQNTFSTVKANNVRNH